MRKVGTGEHPIPVLLRVHTSLLHRENRNRLTQIMLLKSLLQVSAPYREPRRGSNVCYKLHRYVRLLKV